MPDVRNCKRCGRIYNYIGGPPLCHDCRQEDEADFQKVKEYLYDNPGATLSQVAQELEISVEKIKIFLKEGRLEILNNDGNLFLECESCGKAIRSGRLCNDCSNNLTRGFKSAAGEIKSRLDTTRPDTKRDKGSGMRYLGKDDIE